MDPSVYKQLKEDFVSNLSGTSMLEIAALSFLFPAILLLGKWHRVSGSEYATQNLANEDEQIKGIRKMWSSSLCGLLLDFTLIVIPTLSILTILNGKVYILTLSFLAVVPLLFLMGRKQPQGYRVEITEKKQAHFFQVKYLSSYRFVVMLVTCLSILAVDFSIFPRRYAKTETYGTGLMDVGVGSFVLMNALVSKQARGISTLKKSGIGCAFQNTGPLLVLGFARLYFTKGVDYQVHVGEYGVHWNFFFTLAAVALLTNMFNIPAKLSGVFGTFILVVYQLMLLSGLNNYLNSAERSASLISQNKEGIFSLLGYWGLYLLGVQLGYAIFQARRLVKGERTLLDATGIWTLALFFWVLTLLADRFLEKVSRRSCNLSYVLFIVAVNFEGIGVLVLSEWIPNMKQLWLEQIFTDNMLSTFLLANVLTGLVNLSVNTIVTPTGIAYCILVLYSLVLVTGMGLMKILNFKIKL